MAYSTYAELAAITGTTLSTATLEAIIAQADREINAKLYAAGLTPPVSDDMLKAASLDLAHIAVIVHTRIMNEEARHPESAKRWINDGQDREIKELRERAWEIVNAYITYSSSSCPLPSIAIVGRRGRRIGEYEEMTEEQEDDY